MLEDGHVTWNHQFLPILTILLYDGSGGGITRKCELWVKIPSEFA